MAIYTRGGDSGETSWPGGTRMPKSDPRCEASGAIDELNALIGWCLAAPGIDASPTVVEGLSPVGGELMQAGAALAGAEGASLDDAAAVARMEKQIDGVAERLGALEHFILPGGCEPACRLHLARCAARRAERRLVAVRDAGADAPPTIVRYLNRLGDLLFALARQANADAGAPDTQWSDE